MSISIALEEIMPGALYRGSLTDNTPEAYAAIEWLDPRPKPPFSKLHEAHGAVIKEDLKTLAGKMRYKRQRNGYTYQGKMYNVDANAIAALTMAYSLATTNSSYSTQWKLADGKFISMSSASVIGVFKAVTGFVQALFNAEATLNAGIDAGSVTKKEQILSAINTVPNSS